VPWWGVLLIVWALVIALVILLGRRAAKVRGRR
jgi:hypothetical protein